MEEDRLICYKCAEPISDKLNTLSVLSSKEKFDSLKKEILEQCHQLYDDTITNDIEVKINEIYKNTSIERTEKAIEKQTIKKNFISNYMLTTGYEFSGYKINKYVGIVSGQVVLGTGFLSEFSASFADFFGEQSNKFADKLEKAKDAATEKLIIKAADKGGNAIIGVDFDYIMFHGNMIGVIANGTSVMVEKIES